MSLNILNEKKKEEFFNALKVVHSYYEQLNLGRLNFGDLTIDKKAKISEVLSFITLFKSMIVSTKLIRIGSKGDGGYLIPDDFKEVKFCFSPGINEIVNFENDLAEKFGIKSFMIDGSIKKPPLSNNLFKFKCLNLGSKNDKYTTTLSNWIKNSVDKKETEMILQMDIEGSEYEVLIETSIETLSRFRAIIIEFHGLNNLFEQFYLKVIASIFNKLGTHFSIAHCHPNNCCGEVKVENITVPRVLEITFIRNDRIKYVSEMNPFTLPHHLDEKNVKKNPDLLMPEIWWK
tara:strand:- start:256 stop:1122 length:867 start_codon:yes stop_codon:yes gene_type:complete